MNITVQYEIKSDYRYIKYLRENSYWYKYLNRNINYIKPFKDDMKKSYKLTFEDKLDRFKTNLDRAKDFIDIFT